MQFPLPSVPSHGAHHHSPYPLTFQASSSHHFQEHFPDSFLCISLGGHPCAQISYITFVTAALQSSAYLSASPCYRELFKDGVLFIFASPAILNSRLPLAQTTPLYSGPIPPTHPKCILPASETGLTSIRLPCSNEKKMPLLPSPTARSKAWQGVYELASVPTCLRETNTTIFGGPG